MSHPVNAGTGRASARQRPNKSKNKNEHKKNHPQTNYNQPNFHIEDLPPPPSYSSLFGDADSAPPAYDSFEDNHLPCPPGGPALYFNPDYKEEEEKKQQDAIEHNEVLAQNPRPQEIVNAPREKRGNPCSNFSKWAFVGGIVALSILGLGGVYLTSQENNFSVPINKTDIVGWPIQQNESLPVYNINSTQDNANLTQIEIPISNATVNISKTNTAHPKKINAEPFTSLQNLIQSCPPLTKNRIKMFIKVDDSLKQEKNKDKLTQIILDTAKSEHEIEKIIKIIFKYKSNFKIYILSENKFKNFMETSHLDGRFINLGGVMEKNKVSIFYNSFSNRIFINEKALYSTLPLVIKSDFYNAFWHTLHCFSDPKTAIFNVWFNDKQKIKIFNNLELGEKRIIQRGELISNAHQKYINNKKLSKKEKKAINEIIIQYSLNSRLNNPIQKIQSNADITPNSFYDITTYSEKRKAIARIFRHDLTTQVNMIYTTYPLKLLKIYYGELHSTMDEILQSIPLK